MIYSTVSHQRGEWVGQKKSKTWWRNTWMPPIIWNLHWNFTDVSMLSKEVTSSLSRKYFNKFENFQCPTFWTNIIPSLDVFLHLWHSLNAKSAVHWKLGHCIFASRNMYLLFAIWWCQGFTDNWVILNKLPGKELQVMAKGQLISKCLFVVLNSSKKRTKKFDLTTVIPQVELFSFNFWKIEDTKNTFQN